CWAPAAYTRWALCSGYCTGGRWGNWRCGSPGLRWPSRVGCFCGGRCCEAVTTLVDTGAARADAAGGVDAGTGPSDEHRLWRILRRADASVRDPGRPATGGGADTPGRAARGAVRTLGVVHAAGIVAGRHDGGAAARPARVCGLAHLRADDRVGR